ncbi:hypothetical protein PsorP6_013620 [Peronosclerospora sorghi]|uniref:Uncharacterized protein n=1 Tax=Peronosclerospora sorghi TaxID=230839 RepID=A0ACC0VG27_9STRA|nr:hypothetical protein PsorP6_013620 [Peronosclerospora sorghi]
MKGRDPGTAGTIAGISTFLKEQNADMKVWLIDPEETAAVAVFINNKRSTSMMEDGFEMVPMAKGSTIAEGVAALAWVNENLRKSIADQDAKRTYWNPRGSISIKYSWCGPVMGGGGAVPTPHLVDSLTPEQQGQMAAQMGMTPEQLRGLSQMLSNLPPGAMEQMIASMSGGGLESLDGGARAGTGAAGHRIILSEEEAAAADRLCELGFERSDMIQAYLACDKNEALAANFLMDSGDSFGGGAAGSAAGEQGEDNDDIYG